jgi:nicotinamide-nucleotide amidase
MTHDLRTLAEAALDLCRIQGLMLATAESCTGGMISSALTAIAGSSDVFDRGFVTYSNAAKQDMLGVKAASLDKFGAVSEQVASEMASGALEHSPADVAVAVTGIAGPGASHSKPEGRVCFGLAISGQTPVTMTCEFGAIGREAVRTRTTETALRLIIDQLSPKTGP